MFFTVVEFELGIPGSKTLKDKRKVVLSVITRLKSRYNIAIAEERKDERAERARFYFVTLNSSERELDSTLSKIEDYLSNLPNAVLLSYQRESMLIEEF
ncbi:MAG: hypothetical protein DRI22_04855 [Caldiserica bacterium]|nr:MAG: hypothetical protein DRI22_04855 [Caldisericota bacterium]RLD15154.1 MAG: hypothetical protein DRI28_01435 [Caldisericota bacterium]